MAVRGRLLLVFCVCLLLFLPICWWPVVLLSKPALAVLCLSVIISIILHAVRLIVVSRVHIVVIVRKSIIVIVISCSEISISRSSYRASMPAI